MKLKLLSLYRTNNYLPHKKQAARLRWSDAAMLIDIEDDYLIMLDLDT